MPTTDRNRQAPTRVFDPLLTALTEMLPGVRGRVFRVDDPKDAADLPKVVRTLLDKVAGGEPVDDEELQDLFDECGDDECCRYTVPAARAFDGDDLLVMVDLPGVRKGSVTVSTAGDVLHVTAERAELPGAYEVIGDEALRGPVERAFLLPASVTSEQVSAKLTDGVLQVRIKKAEASREPFDVTVN